MPWDEISNEKVGSSTVVSFSTAEVVGANGAASAVVAAVAVASVAFASVGFVSGELALVCSTATFGLFNSGYLCFSHVCQPKKRAPIKTMAPNVLGSKNFSSFP